MKYHQYKYLFILTFTLLPFQTRAQGKIKTQPQLMEIPQIPTNLSRYSIISHSYRLKGKKVRNMMICYDTYVGYPLWVSYPMNSSFLGKVKRSNNFRQDPLLNISSDYHKGLGDRLNDRGHLLPSAARTATKVANIQTFYYTNVIPQSSRLNRGSWKKLETLVRTITQNQGLYDTLYVVTGNIVSNTAKKVKNIIIPSYCYKALLLIKQRYIGAKKHYYSTAFLLRNDRSDQKDLSKTMLPISSLENMTNIHFFPMLPKSIAKEIKCKCLKKNWLGKEKKFTL